MTKLSFDQLIPELFVRLSVCGNAFKKKINRLFCMADSCADYCVINRMKTAVNWRHNVSIKLELEGTYSIRITTCL